MSDTLAEESAASVSDQGELPLSPLHPESHAADSASGSSPEQAAVYAIAVLGLVSNLALIVLILLQRHTRRLTSAFVIHSAFLNLLMSCLTMAFGRGLDAEGISSGSCRTLTIGYIVFLTVWVFNLIPTVCCEIFHLDSGAGRPSSSMCCAAFGVCLVYVCSAILHLGPTLIGSNFQWRAKNTRCMFLHGQTKNYTVHLMWIVIVMVALAGTGYLLVVFHRAIDSSMRSRIRSRIPGRSAFRGSSGPLDFASGSDATLADRLNQLAALKANRQKVLCGLCGLFALCWFPLYFLVLSDPLYKAPDALYHLFTVLGFAKTLLEPLMIATCDRSVGRNTTMRMLPCTRGLGYASERDIDTLLAAAAAAGCPERSDSTSAIASGSSTGGGGFGVGGDAATGSSRGGPMPPPLLHHSSSSSNNRQQQLFLQRLPRPRIIGDTPPVSDLLDPSPISF